ncbi:lantibiotic epidermin biosynthesis protein EpiC [Desmospora sp. 8437]|nr:lantibiotic epidermin biosynthesis protein EpiC [Desmospora sp. 8437]
MVKAIATSEKNLSVLGGHPWHDVTVANGYPGLVVFYAEMDRFDPKGEWDLVAHHHLLALQKGIQENGIYSWSSFLGLAGIAFSISMASQNKSRYTLFLEEIHQILLQRITGILEEEKRKEEKEPGVDPMVYDVISGFAGVGRYLLREKDDPETRQVLKELIRYLVRLSEPIQVKGYKVPGWYVPRRYQFTEEDKINYSEGSFNCGLSHGIPGPLALLSLAFSQGVEVEGQREAIGRMADWLLRCRVRGDHGYYWPSVVTFRQEITTSTQLEQTRDAWCYGTAGVAYSLYLAGQALGVEEYKKSGFEGFRAIFDRPSEIQNLDGPTFCHGLSGLVHLAHRLSRATGDARLMEQACDAAVRLLNLYEPESPYGYVDLEGNKRVHKAGLLDGAAGVALTLLSFEMKEEPMWDQLFLLS